MTRVCWLSGGAGRNEEQRSLNMGDPGTNVFFLILDFHLVWHKLFLKRWLSWQHHLMADSLASTSLYEIRY